ncbi:hypothetical protein [Peribacillus sp. NPDC096540]|uniref:hypothetical protein n=1 Tax=Peribacillus sp. NPDC096540 TaxID=3390612 RepID=UPI003D073068
MENKMNIIPLFFLFMIILLALYLESSSLESLHNTEPFLIGQESVNDAEQTMAETKEQTNSSEEFELDERLINKEVIDGYLVETYREYEIYKDQSGKVTKVIPTSNYNYIRYKIYN